MLRTMFIGILICFVACWSLAQEATQGAKIEFEQMEHDFGKIEKGSKVTATFKFKNSGTETLNIKDVTTSCGCTSAKPSKTSYAAGEAGEIPVTFNSGRFSGTITKRVTIITNDKTTPRTVLTIKATVLVDVEAKPASLFVNKLKRGEVRTEEIMLSTEKLDQLEITDLSSDRPYLIPKLESIDDKHAKIVVTVDSSLIPKGESRMRGFISFNTNSRTQRSMRIHANVLIENPITILPSSVYMFGSKQGQTREVLVRLKSSEGKAFDLSDVQVDVSKSGPEPQDQERKPADFISTDLKRDPNGDYLLKVTLTDSAEKCRFDGFITLKTNLPEQPECRIPIRGKVI